MTAARSMGAMILLLVSTCVVVGCGTPRRGEPIAGPLHLENSQAVRGEQIYMRHCDKCHPGGEAGLGYALNNKPLPGFMIKTQVRMGMGAMPRFSQKRLPPDQLDDLVVYMKALRANGR